MRNRNFPIFFNIRVTTVKEKICYTGIWFKDSDRALKQKYIITIIIIGGATSL